MREKARPWLGLTCALASFGCRFEEPPRQATAGTQAAGSSVATGEHGGAASGGAAMSLAGGAGREGVGGSTTGGASAGGASAGGASAGGASAGGASAGGATSGKLAGTPVVFIGGFGPSYPLRAYDLNKATGALTARGGPFDAGTDPSYLTLDPSRTHLYAANENDGPDGGVTALRIKPDGSLTKLNHQTGTDKGFTYVAVDPSGKYVLAASYNGGSVSVFPIGSDGSVGAQSGNLDFGDTSQAHGVGFDLSGKYAFVPTKGADKIQQLRLGGDGKLSANTPASVASAGGAGPRHIVVHPSGKLAFVANENDSTVTPYQLSPDGKLTAGASVSSLPPGFTGINTGAHVELSPDGRFLYASNRGHDSIAVFSVEPSTGSLALLETEPTRGKTPRDFDVDPNGDVLIVANQDSANLSVYKIEPSGQLSPLGTPTASASMPSAVQIHYLP